MQKFNALLQPSYHFTDNYSELPAFLLLEIDKALHIDWKQEELVASCWIPNTKGKVFVLVTTQRVAYSDTIRVRQNLLKDMTGVEKNLLKNIILLSPGNSTKLWGSFDLPVEKLRDLMFDIINATWIRSRQAKPSEQPDTADIPQQIEKLNELKKKGILTDQEFQDKKTELLARI